MIVMTNEHISLLLILFGLCLVYLGSPGRERKWISFID